MSNFPAMLRKFTILKCRNYVCMPFSHHITHLFILKGGVSIYGDDAKENGDFQERKQRLQRYNKLTKSAYSLTITHLMTLKRGMNIYGDFATENDSNIAKQILC